MPMLKSAAANVLVRLSRKADAEHNYALADHYDFLREALRLAGSPTHISDDDFNNLWHTDKVQPMHMQDLSAPNSVPRDENGKPLPGLKTPEGFLAQSDMQSHVHKEMTEMNKRLKAKPQPLGNSAAAAPQAPELTETQLKQVRFRPSPMQVPMSATASSRR